MLKDKQFYSRERRLLGPAISLAKQLSQNYKFLHVVDLDLKKGLTKNLDIYDKLTYFIRVQVEMWKETKIDKFLEYNVRLIAIPGIYSDPSFYKGVLTDKKEETSPFKDVVTSNPELLSLNKRIFLLGEKNPRAYAYVEF